MLKSFCGKKAGLPFDFLIPADWDYERMRLLGVDAIVFSRLGTKQMVLTYGRHSSARRIPWGYHLIGRETIPFPGFGPVEVVIAKQNKPIWSHPWWKVLSLVAAVYLSFILWSTNSAGAPGRAALGQTLIICMLYFALFWRRHTTLKAALVLGGTEYVFTTHTQDLNEADLVNAIHTIN